MGRVTLIKPRPQTGGCQGPMEECLSGYLWVCNGASRDRSRPQSGRPGGPMERYHPSTTVCLSVHRQALKPGQGRSGPYGGVPRPQSGRPPCPMERCNFPEQGVPTPMERCHIPVRQVMCPYREMTSFLLCIVSYLNKG
jgi:hypothetical protein